MMLKFLLTSSTKGEEMGTRAQIGIYDGSEITEFPIVLIYRHNDGYPTGHGGVVPALSLMVPEIIKERGTYDAAGMAASLVHRLINEQREGGYPGYGISNSFKPDIRFFYAVTAQGVTVFDAREIIDVDDITDKTPMFFTAWEEPERVRQVEHDIAELEQGLKKKRLELVGLRRKHL